MSDDDNLSTDELENSEEIEASPQKLKPRGPTTGKRSAKKKGPRHIRFDENDVPVGEWSVDFSTQMGVRARHIKITFKTWKEVPNGKKDTIWRHVKCPQQPGDFECGYYVMKWMYDITVHYAKKTVPLEKCISKSTVAAKDINRVREFWCRNFLDGMYI